MMVILQKKFHRLYHKLKLCDSGSSFYRKRKILLRYS